jgi:hypothetical protein
MAFSINNYPHCFGDLDIVFPMSKNGLRVSPKTCLACEHKTSCLRNALQNSKKGNDVKQEHVDRAYESGMIGFWERWSRKKSLNRQTQNKLQRKRRHSFWQLLKNKWLPNNKL